MRRISQWRSPNTLAYIGDSRLRFLYNETVSHITGSPPIYPNGNHHDVTTDEKSLNLSLQFVWAPFVDGDMQRAIDRFLLPHSPLPSLILLSSGTWTMKISNSSEKAFKEYKRNLTELAPSLEKLAQRTRVVWVLQDPVFEYLLSEEREMIRNNEIWKYNYAAEVSYPNFAVRVILTQ